MFILILLIVFGLIIVGSAIALFVVKTKIIPAAVGGLALVIGAFVFFFSVTFVQDTGDASVLVSWTGDIVGQETAPGLHTKAPWVAVKTFNVRNQSVSYTSDQKGTDYTGGSAKGPFITVFDSDGVPTDLDVTVYYNIRPDQVTNIYKKYRDETGFVSNFVYTSIRSAIRKAPNNFATLDVLSKQTALQNAVQAEVEKAWQGSGVEVESVSLQDVNPPQAIKDRYSQAVQSQIKVTQAKNELAAAQVQSQQQVVQAKANGEAQVAAAQGAAKANSILERSLTPRVLQQHALDTMAKVGQNGGTVIVGGGAQTLLQVGKK